MPALVDKGHETDDADAAAAVGTNVVDVVGKAADGDADATTGPRLTLVGLRAKYDSYVASSNKRSELFGEVDPHKLDVRIVRTRISMEKGVRHDIFGTSEKAKAASDAESQTALQAAPIEAPTEASKAAPKKAPKTTPKAAPKKASKKAPKTTPK
jgi:hypothetical protein